MRTVAILGIAAAAALFTGGSADAARWCHEGARAQGCAFPTRARCLATARRVGGTCHRQVARRAQPAPQRQVYPSRPYWAAPGECYTDDGYGRFRLCSAGEGDGGLQ